VSAAAQVDGLSEPDLIDRIANALPVEVRSDYYQELRHCRSLPSNDEMLRILRAMQFLTMLMVQVPERVGTEREKLEQLLTDGMRTLQTTLESSNAYQEQLDQRLEQLPENIVSRISPEAIAKEINESLRQQFVKSTIPDTARALAAVAKQMQDVTTDFGRTATALGNRYDGAAAQALRAIQDIQRISSDAITTARHGAQELLDVFHQEYRWLICAASGLALLIGFGLGLSWYRWFAAPALTVDSSPAVQTPPPAKPRLKH
jgi:hypothetical protein